MAPAAYSTLFFHIPPLQNTAPPSAPQLPSFLSLDPSADSILSVSTTAISHKSRKSRKSPSPSSSTSATSARSIPRPKPVPAATVPAIPRRTARSQDSPRRVPRIAAPVPPVPPVPTRPPRPASIITSTSAASTHHRTFNRTDALARLEGRVPLVTGPQSAVLPRRISPPPYSPYAAVPRTKSAAPVLATRSFMPFSEDDSDSDDPGSCYDFELDTADAFRVELELELDLVVSPETPSDMQLPTPKKVRRKTIDSWLVGPPSPSFKNFMDFGDERVDDRVDIWGSPKAYL